MRTQFFQFKILHNQTPSNTQRAPSFSPTSSAPSQEQTHKHQGSRVQMQGLVPCGGTKLWTELKTPRTQTAIWPPRFSVLSCSTQTDLPHLPQGHSQQDHQWRNLSTRANLKPSQTLSGQSCSAGLRHGLWGQVHQACNCQHRERAKPWFSYKYRIRKWNMSYLAHEWMKEPVHEQLPAFVKSTLCARHWSECFLWVSLFIGSSQRPFVVAWMPDNGRLQALCLIITIGRHTIVDSEFQTC